LDEEKDKICQKYAGLDHENWLWFIIIIQFVVTWKGRSNALCQECNEYDLIAAECF
jgi:hypothetical protein